MANEQPTNEQSNKQKYLDEKGRVYVIERLACCASLGKVSKNVYILYENGTKATISFETHSSHSKLEKAAQSLAKGRKSEECRGEDNSLDYGRALDYICDGKGPSRPVLPTRQSLL